MWIRAFKDDFLKSVGGELINTDAMASIFPFINEEDKYFAVIAESKSGKEYVLAKLENKKEVQAFMDNLSGNLDANKMLDVAPN